MLLLTQWQRAGGLHRGVISLNHHQQPPATRGASSSLQSHAEGLQLNAEDTDAAAGLTLSRIRMVWASHDAHAAPRPTTQLDPPAAGSCSPSRGELGKSWHNRS